MSDSPRYAARWLYLLTAACLALAVGCHSFKLLGDRPDKPEKSEKDQGLAAPSKRSLRVSQFVFLSDFELQRNLPIFRELSDLRDQVYKDLQLPSATTVIQVHLFEDRTRYERFMLAKYPDLPKRRAFFVAQPRSVGGTEDLLVYTYWGDRIQQDLRHELTHALLHSVLKDVPLWLDEGLAEYFEVPPDWNGTNYRHLGLLRHSPDGSFKPDLARLEQLNEVQQMTPAEYREAWAWVHFMLRTRPEAKAVLLAYLQQLRTNPNPGPLGPRLAAVVPAVDDALNRHLDQLEATMRPPASVQP
jgi:hypothetical protein